MRTHSRSGMAILLLLHAALPGAADAQGVAPLRLGTSLFIRSPRPPLSDSVSSVLSPPRQLAFYRVAPSMPECTMPVLVPNLSAVARMPGSHAPGSQSVGTERYGCTNPRGPRATP